MQYRKNISYDIEAYIIEINKAIEELLYYLKRF